MGSLGAMARGSATVISSRGQGYAQARARRGGGPGSYKGPVGAVVHQIIVAPGAMGYNRLRNHRRFPRKGTICAYYQCRINESHSTAFW